MLQLELLWALQNTDKEIMRIKKNIKNKESLIRLNNLKSEYGHLKESLTKDVEQKENLNKDSEALNTELQNLDDRVKAESKRLYDEAVPLKIIENLQNEIGLNKGKIDKIENDLLDIIEKNDHLSESIKNKKEKLLRLKNEFDWVKAEYNKEFEGNQINLEKLQDKRLELLKDIQPELIKQYDDIAGKRNYAVSKVESGICSQCGVKLNAILYDKLKKKTDLCLCDHCGRILYQE